MQVIKQTNTIAFGSIRIGEVNLSKIKHGKKVGLEKAFITMFDDKDIQDANVITKLQEKWTKNSSKLPPHEAYLVEMETRGICENFVNLYKSQTQEHAFCSDYNTLHKRVFLALELPGKSCLESRILGFIKIRDNEKRAKSLEGAFLVVNPLYIAQNKKRKIGGIGETLFLKAIQIAKTGKFQDFVWKSDNNPFYINLLKKAGIIDFNINKSGSNFILPRKYFEILLNCFDKKYKMNFSGSDANKELDSFRHNSN